MKGSFTHDEPTNVRITTNEKLSELAAKIHKAVKRRAYELYLSRGREKGSELGDWQRAESELLRSTPEDVTESAYGNVKLRVEMPGFAADEIEVGVEPRRVIVCAQKERQDNTWPAQEAETKSEWTQPKSQKPAWPADEAEPKSESHRFLRVYDLPRPVEPGKATATFADPILTIEVPRASGASRSAAAQGL